MQMCSMMCSSDSGVSVASFFSASFSLCFLYQSIHAVCICMAWPAASMNGPGHAQLGVGKGGHGHGRLAGPCQACQGVTSGDFGCNPKFSIHAAAYDRAYGLLVCGWRIHLDLLKFQ